MNVPVIIGDAELYLGDCRKILPTLGKVDTVVTDPPYGIGHKHKILGGIIGDDQAFDPTHCLIGTEHIIWGANHFASRLPNATRWLVWIKHDAGLFGKRDHAPFDLAWTDLGGSGRAFRHIWDASIRQGEAFGKPNVHPHQKPVELMEWCLGFTAGHVVCDPFMGSGTTGIACARLGRRFVGIEIDPKHFETACRRIDKAQHQGRLFDNRPLAPKQETMNL